MQHPANVVVFDELLHLYREPTDVLGAIATDNFAGKVVFENKNSLSEITHLQFANPGVSCSNCNPTNDSTNREKNQIL